RQAASMKKDRHKCRRNRSEAGKEQAAGRKSQRVEPVPQGLPVEGSGQVAGARTGEPDLARSASGAATARQAAQATGAGARRRLASLCRRRITPVPTL